MTGTNKPTVTIYTDGGCVPNPGMGGWAAILVAGEKRRELSGGEPNTTNNRMELTAAVEALSVLKRPCRVTLYTDSEYVQRGITAWMPQWKRNQWKRKGGELKNVDLWRALDAAVTRHEVDWRWVKGHAGHPENERCDELASNEIARRATVGE